MLGAVIVYRALAHLRFIVAREVLPLMVRPVVRLSEHLELAALLEGHFLVFGDVADVEMAGLVVIYGQHPERQKREAGAFHTRARLEYRTDTSHRGSERLR